MALTRRITNDANSYGWGPITIHWLVALTVFVLFGLGLYIDGLSYYDPEYRTVPHWHKSIGLMLAGLFMLRLGWRVLNRPPAPLPQPRLLTLATHIAHSLLYLVLLLVLVSGYLISTADGRAIAVFNWFEIPALPAPLANQEDIAGDIHEVSAWTLIGLAGLHALAALKHHFINRDDTLRRMFGYKKVEQ
ncbi:MAG: cytochrome b [Marinobacterium sp.]|nr:cytochrome b [Marinobacterium sp.]